LRSRISFADTFWPSGMGVGWSPGARGGGEMAGSSVVMEVEEEVEDLGRR
jgi:hypothetical protein